jgi:hypothetical protein
MNMAAIVPELTHHHTSGEIHHGQGHGTPEEYQEESRQDIDGKTRRQGRKKGKGVVGENRMSEERAD